jgi:hypothetical protein
MSEQIWDKVLAERFNAVKFVWLQWPGSAAASIQERLRDDSED